MRPSTYPAMPSPPRGEGLGEGQVFFGGGYKRNDVTV
jgi:hypothetical protein